MARPTVERQRGVFGGMRMERGGPLSPATRSVPSSVFTGHRTGAGSFVWASEGTAGPGNSPSTWCRCDPLRKVMLTHRYRCQ